MAVAFAVAFGRRLVRAVVNELRGRDVGLHAAALTFYGGIAVVPAALLAIWLTSAVFGRQHLAALLRQPIEALPDAINAGAVAATLVDAGLHLGPWLAVAALIPASLYGEGFRRSLVSLTKAKPTDAVPRFTGWRGRLLLLPLFAAAPALLFALLLALPSAITLLRRGGLAAAGGIVVSFLATTVVLTAVLAWIYRFVGPEQPGPAATAVGAFFTSANLSGFLHGFVLFCSLPLRLGVPFGGLDVIGGVVAVALWLYLLHTIILVGYVMTLALGRRSVTHRRASAP